MYSSPCVCVCVWVLNITDRLYICIYVCACVCVCLHVCVCVCVCIWVHNIADRKYTHTHTHTHTYIYICVCLCVCVHLCVCLGVCVCVCVCVYVIVWVLSIWDREYVNLNQDCVDSESTALGDCQFLAPAKTKLFYITSIYLSIKTLFVHLSLPPTRQDFRQGQITRTSDYSGGFGEGKVEPEPRLEPCWSMQVIGSISTMWADEPSWTWIQTWVQARMPDYSLNWTTGSNVKKTCQ